VRERRGRNILKLAAFLLLLAAITYFMLLTPSGALFRTAEGRSALVGSLDTLVQSVGPLGPVVFILIYTFGVLFFPATPFAIAGAIIFGKFHGMLYNLAADVLGASISFYLGRYFLHGVARGFLETRMPWLDRKATEDGFSVIFYLRIFWFPFIVLNYAAGATRIRFRDYFLGTVLGVLPAVFLFTYFVGAMKEALATYRRPADLLTFDLIFPILLLVFSFFLPTLLKRLRKGRQLLPPDGQP
jgi:uncharacterized membrane protein YdjX (TVP38/TMEM64 family)